MCSRQIATQASASSARTLTLLRLRYQQQPTLRLHHSHTCNTRFFSPSSSSSYSALLSRFSAPSTFTCLQKSPLLTTSRNMFHRAVQEHAQSRPPSIPQRDKNRLSINGFLRGSGRASTTAATALQASAQTTLNTNRPTKPSSAATPSSVPKRPLSSGLASLYNATTAFEENVPRPIDIMPPTSMQALHDAVYFVDSDFDNDSDLDFDISEPIINPSLAAAARMLPSPPDSLKSQSPQPTMQQPSTHRPKDTFDDLEFEPRLPNPAPNPTVQNVIDSSQPFQWSSSPAEHFEPPKRRSDPVEEEAPPPKRKKARAIPWAKKPEAVQEVKKAASKVGPARRTPSDSMPWNESFSNVEAGKKETRKRNAAKRSLTTLATDSELSRKVTKGREPIAPIFLTEEQQRVADLVANHGQSVFFTGSAGRFCWDSALQALLTWIDRNWKVGLAQATYYGAQEKAPKGPRCCCGHCVNRSCRMQHRRCNTAQLRRYRSRKRKRSRPGPQDKEKPEGKEPLDSHQNPDHGRNLDGRR
ncbi:hypothetical protein FN846DRAFT_216748 [Sphaerosporella brunnea]|uniref:Uncharacterized protein n=1 Tax=Sphaerosporella brunnea TaxID=1250544 RepID=A0A5J5F7Y6_9PEZI|nr:hypothetical protein FN846DRAFT_216748 [Sphaerosporella brunnea]